MIVFLTLLYVGVLLILVKLKIVPWNLWTKISPAPFALLLFVSIFIPMKFFAPSGDAIVGRHVVQIVPNVTGEVIEVPVTPNTAVREGDLLFRIDPQPYQAAVDALRAQLDFAEQRLEQARALEARGAGRAFDIDQWNSQVLSLRAQLDNAEFNLGQCEVRAPADGLVTNLALRTGSRVMAAPLAPAMAFVDNSEVMIFVSIHQNNLRHIESGQEAEAVFKVFPGKVFSATVEHVVADLSTGQATPSGLLIAPTRIAHTPFYVRLKLDDDEVARLLPTGATGEVAIFTGGFPISYVIRRTMMRMDTWLNYIIPV